MWLTNFRLLFVENYISKKLDFELDMAKVYQALNIPATFHEWRWPLSEYQKKASGLPPDKDVER